MLELTNNPEVLASLGVQYIASKGLVYRESTDSQINVEVCPICKHDGWHFFLCYAGKKDGLFACHRCSVTGNLRSLQEKLGDKIAGVQSQKDWGGAHTKKIDALPDVDAAHEALLGDADAMYYLLNTRGFSQEVIEQQRIGLLEKHWFKSAGEVRALVIPYLVGDNCIFVKYRTLPPAPKDFNAPTGWDVPLFNGEILKPGLNEIIFVEGECLTGDTEVLTPEGWVRLDEYNGQQVTQWHKDGTATFTQPLAYVRKEYAGELVKFSTPSKVTDLETTVQHNVLYNHRVSGDDVVCKAGDVTKGTKSSNVCFYRTAQLATRGVTVSDADLRMWVAVQADGHLSYQGTRVCCTDTWTFEFSKDRKIKRLKTILSDCNLDYTETITKRGTTQFIVKAARDKYGKIFPKYFYEMSGAQRALFSEEVGYWDSHKRRGEVNYQSCIKENADLVQWSFSMSNIHATQGLYKRPLPRHDIYWVRVNTTRKRGRQNLTCGQTFKTTRQFSGLVYCVQVPSSFIVTRRSYAICITGNCDALALMSQGVENVVGVPGASMKKAAWITELDDIAPERIYILFDNDKAGSKGAQELASRIGIDRCLKLSLPDLKYTEEGVEKHCKDVNDFFAKCGGTVAQFEELKANAKQFDVTGVTSTGDALEELTSHLQGKDSLMPTYCTPWPSLNAKVGFENGDVIDIMAEAKVGKSTLALNLLEFAVKTYNEPGLFICLEMTQMRLARKWVSHVTQTDDSVPKTIEDGKARLVTMLAAVEKARAIASADDRADLYFAHPLISDADDVIKLIRQCHRRYGIKWCVIDNLQLWCDLTLTHLQQRTIHLSKLSKSSAGIARELGLKLIRILQPHQIKEGSIVSARNADGSSQISKDCDCLINGHRNAVGDTKSSTFESAGILDTDTAMDARMLLTVALSRYSAGGSCTLEFVGGTSTVREYTAEASAAIPRRDPSLIRSTEVVKPLFTLPTAPRTVVVTTQVPSVIFPAEPEEITI